MPWLDFVQNSIVFGHRNPADMHQKSCGIQPVGLQCGRIARDFQFAFVSWQASDRHPRIDEQMHGRSQDLLIEVTSQCIMTRMRYPMLTIKNDSQQFLRVPGQPCRIILDTHDWGSLICSKETVVLLIRSDLFVCILTKKSLIALVSGCRIQVAEPRFGFLSQI